MNHDDLLARAVADRNSRPWRYYRLEYDELKKFTESMADQRDMLLVALTAVVRAYDGPTVDIGTSIAATIPAARTAIVKTKR